jgi:hypothetical protein
MTAEHRHISDTTRRASEGLLDALRRWREVDRSTPEPAAAGPLRVIDANRAIVERAKGALMLRYGIDSYQAFALLVRWSRVTKAPVPTIAHTLLHGICEGNPETELRQRGLVRWLEAQLRYGDADLGRPPAARSWFHASA